MKIRLIAAFFVLCAATLAAQAPTTPDAAPVPIPPPPPPSDVLAHTNDLGFSYSLPSDWEVVDTKPMLPAVLQQAARNYGSEAEKLVACVQLPLTAHHGNPPSAIVVMGLSFDCIGHPFTAADLPGIASGVSEGMKKSVEIANPVNNTYTLGTHSLWIQRASGSLIGHPEIKRTVETVCSVLKKGVVCWMVMTADDAALQTFENGTVTLDGDAATALVPADALQKKP
jgi:hypothetical protein